MNFKTFFTPKVRKGTVHSFFAIIFLIIILFLFPLSSMNTPKGKLYAWPQLVIPLLIISEFYFHSFILLPILLQRKHIKKYVFLVLVSLIVCWITFFWFHAFSSVRSGLTRNMDGTILTVYDMFAYGISDSITFIPLLILAFLPFGLISSVYYLSLIDNEERKGLFSFKYLELIINLIMISSVFILILSTMSNGIFIIFYLAVLLAFFYVNTFFVTPILLIAKKVGKYLLIVVLLFLLAVQISKGIHHITHFEIGPFPNILAMIITFFIVYALSFIYGFSRIHIKVNKQLLNLNLGSKDSELQLLKSQVNPHFLFNTLNTLYATALEENAPKTAESTAKLANLIRYMQEDINKDFIPLENEIKYVQDYILIQKLRFAIEPDIETDFKNIDNYSISPGLLIPFIENAFKYGINPSKKSNLKVAVICNENTIHFECINSYDDTFKTYHKEQGFGIGIKNAKQRLELVYPKNHTFEVKRENNMFSVKINITVKN